jgi:DNA-binding Lrp family transcriptional regulator
MPKSSKRKIEEDEKKVALALQKNARESIDAIGKVCGFSRQKVWRIIKRLEKSKDIWGYTGVIDDEMLEIRRYQILVKREPSFVTSDLLDIVFKRKLDEIAEKLDVELENSLLTHGPYDWMFTVTAPNILQVKKFIEAFQKIFSKYVERIDILEVLFPVKKNGILNPDMKSLKDYFPESSRR